MVMLRRRFSDAEEAPGRVWIWRWYHPMVALGASLAFLLLLHLTPPVLYGVTLLLIVPPALEALWVGWNARRISRAADDSQALSVLLRVAGLSPQGGEGQLIETYSPGRPGCIEIRTLNGSHPVGLFTRKLVAPAQEGAKQVENQLTGDQLSSCVELAVLAVKVIGRDLRLVLKLDGPPRLQGATLLQPPCKADEDAAWLLHRQLWAIPSAVFGRADLQEPVLSAKRYEEAVEEPTPLTFDCLQARLQSGGGARRASRWFGVDLEGAQVVRFGSRIYDVNCHTTIPRWRRLLLRLTVKAFLLNANSVGQRSYLPRTLQWLEMLADPAMVKPDIVAMALMDLCGRASQYPEKLALANAIAAEEVRRMEETCPARDRTWALPLLPSARRIRNCVWCLLLVLLNRGDDTLERCVGRDVVFE